MKFEEMFKAKQIEMEMNRIDGLIANRGVYYDDEAVEGWIHSTDEKYYVNLKGVNALALHRAGVQSVDISPFCTACRTDLFWSHRRHGSSRGSQGAIIVCKEADR